MMQRTNFLNFSISNFPCLSKKKKINVRNESVELQFYITPVQDPELADIRSRLVEASEAGELDALTVWVDKFVEKNMDDRGDLTEARKKLHLAKLNRGESHIGDHRACIELELGVPRNTCVTCPDSFRKLIKGNNSKNIDARVMNLVHGS